MTAINYPDLTVTSAAGLVRLEARSPDNDPDHPRRAEGLPEGHPRRIWNGFQDDFVYTARRTDSGQVLWRRRQADSDDESAPRSAFIHDDGHAVIITVDTFSSHILVINPAGRIVLDLDVSPLLPEREFHWTSAGPHWDQGSHAYFAELDGSLHWCIRTTRGRRLSIDLPRARLIADPSTFDAPLAAAETDWVLATLRDAPRKCEAWRDATGRWADWPDGVFDVLTAAQMAGVLSVDAATPHLLALESCGLIGATTSCAGLDELGPRQRHASLSFLPVRQMAQLSLRRLGASPMGCPPFIFSFDSEDPEAGRMAAPERPWNRDDLAASVLPGTPMRDVLATLGTPDALDTRGQWDYDSGAGAHGRTLRIQFDREHRVSAVTNLPTPGWDPDYRREDGII